MKEIIAAELEVGDLIYRGYRYGEVIRIQKDIVYLKCIMGPTSVFIKIGDEYHISKWLTVTLLCRDGKKV